MDEGNTEHKAKQYPWLTSQASGDLVWRVLEQQSGHRPRIGLLRTAEFGEKWPILADLMESTRFRYVSLIGEGREVTVSLSRY